MSDYRHPQMINRSSPVRVLLADDHPFVLRGVTSLIESARDLCVVACCANGDEAMQMVLEQKPDVAVLDVNMPGATCLEILHTVAKKKLTTRIVYLTAFSTDQMVFDAVAAGLQGLLLKEDAPDLLLNCIRAVANGQSRLSPELVRLAAAKEASRRQEHNDVPRALTLREREIANLISIGLSNKHIARELGISDATVKVHLRNIFEKMGLPNRAALAAVAATEKQGQGFPEK